MSRLHAVATNQLERVVLRDFLALPFQHFGVCCRCGLVEDEDGRALWLAGRVQGGLVCFTCFDESGAPGRRLAA